MPWMHGRATSWAALKNRDLLITQGQVTVSNEVRMGFPTMFRHLTTTALVCSASWSLVAAESSTNEIDALDGSAVIVVSATRTEADRNLVPTVVDVVDASDLRLQGTPVRLQDQLRGITGIVSSQTLGGFAGGGGLLIRGGRSHQTQILLDGVPYNDAASTQGMAGHHLFVLPGLERIEVAKGAQSGIYGSGASAGAIDLQGIRPTDELSYGGRLEYGSFNTISGSANASGMISDEVGFAVSANHLSTDGVSVLTSSEAGGDPEDFEDDAFMRTGFSGRISWERDTTEVFASLIYLVSDSEYDGFNAPDDDEPNTEQDSVRLHTGLRMALSETIDFDADLSYSTYNRELSGTPANTFDSTDIYASVRGHFAVHEAVDLTAALDYRDQSADVYSPFFGMDTIFDETESIVGLWVQAEARYENLTAVAVVRYDDHSREGDASTFRLGLSYALLDETWVLHASAGTGFRAPSLYELYSYYGNPDLEPEESFTYDAGHRLQIGEIAELEQSMFYTGWHEAIRWVLTDPMTFDGEYQNVGPVSSAYVYGFENTLTVRPVEALELRVNLTFQDSDDGSLDGNEMTVTPHVVGGITGTWQQEVAGRQGWLTVGVDHLGKRFRDTSNNTELPAITTVRAVVGYEATDDVTVTLRGENLFDEQESPNIGSTTNYTMVPMAVYLGISAQF